ncbi:hypothetical protein GBAR_LOCUS2791 [Geodia barretti]|uniref:Uncharacterized protein n=1 Tax=Geodia barretti TaxID=519541 RepID=A0AA35R0T0_GEOBA|nr:hypothetical protein GBAR_LOCUS2791 [Geodia barretti]
MQRGRILFGLLQLLPGKILWRRLRLDSSHQVCPSLLLLCVMSHDST